MLWINKQQGQCRSIVKFFREIKHICPVVWTAVYHCWCNGNTFECWAVRHRFELRTTRYSLREPFDLYCTASLSYSIRKYILFRCTPTVYTYCMYLSQKIGVTTPNATFSNTNPLGDTPWKESMKCYIILVKWKYFFSTSCGVVLRQRLDQQLKGVIKNGWLTIQGYLLKPNSHYQ